jgi:hypothetical protein
MQQNWQVSPPACFWLHRSAKGLIFSIFTDSHKIARSNSVVSAFVKIETGRSRICLSEAMASALASPNARSCAQRRISYACVPHPAFSSRSRYPAIKLSVSRSSKSQRILLPLQDLPPNRHPHCSPSHELVAMSSLSHHGSLPSGIPMSKPPPFSTSALVPRTGLGRRRQQILYANANLFSDAVIVFSGCSAISSQV